MPEKTEGKNSVEVCLDEQRKLFSSIAKVVETASQVVEMDNRLSAEIREVRSNQETFQKSQIEFQKTLQPVLDAYQKGMTLKSKVGTIAICYVFAIVLFPPLSPTSILSVIKMLL